MGFFDSLPRFFGSRTLLTEEKADLVAKGIYLLTGGQAVFSPQNYETYSRQGYAGNVWAYRAVNQIARASAGIPWLLYRNSRVQANAEELTTHPLLDLLARPNPEQGQAAFIEELMGYWQISGNDFCSQVGDDNLPPTELWNLRPDRITILPDEVNRVWGYRYTLGSFQEDFHRSTCHHFKLFHPYDDWWGLSPIQIASRIIDLDTEALKHEVAILQNGAMVPGAIVTDKVISESQLKEMEVSWNKRRSGTKQSGRPWFLHGGWKWQQMGLSPTDLSILEMEKWDAARICAAYGVPGELVGLIPATYQNRREAKKALYTEVVLPLMDRLRDDFNNWLTPQFGDYLRLDYDRDKIDALQEDREKQYTRLGKATWLTVNEKRAESGYEPIEGGDELEKPQAPQANEDEGNEDDEANQAIEQEAKLWLNW